MKLVTDASSGAEGMASGDMYGQAAQQILVITSALLSTVFCTGIDSHRDKPFKVRFCLVCGL